ncbi:MAG: endo-1,3-alpha-glucanase family glycosylhydrolase [Terriglobales bacterium]
MVKQGKIALAVVGILLLQACAPTHYKPAMSSDLAKNSSVTKTLAVYEPWFGHPQHISVGYSSHDPAEIRKQINEAENMGISGFVVDWYGDREPFLDQSYALMQSIAAQMNFHVAMMYDETEGATDQATDEALAAFQKFNSTYLASDAPGRSAYLMYNGRPVIFIFPKGGTTNWHRVREVVDKWEPAPLLIYEQRQTPYVPDFDGFYAWINPGKKGWASDGSNWGEDYLRAFYTKMTTQYPDKIAVGAVWAGFDDSKASWSLNRRMSQRCGATLVDTMNLVSQYYTPDRPLPFLLIATWNDYEEGSAIEAGLAKCKPGQEKSAGN